MPIKLDGGIADVIPGRLLRDELVEMHANLRIIVKAVSVDRKGFSCARFPKRRAAARAKAPVILVRGSRFISLHHVLSPYPAKGVSANEYKSARADFAAAAAMAGRHHRGWFRKFKAYPATTAATCNHFIFLDGFLPLPINSYPGDK